MNTEELQTKKELERNDIKPVKYKGQNFLISETIIKKIIAAADIKSGETILEIGAGTGNLTESLLAAGAGVIAVEKDKKLAGILKFRIKNLELKIIEGDILRSDENSIAAPYKIVANI